MFKKTGHQFVEDSARGISLEATGPYSFLYKDNDNELELTSEALKEGDGPYSVCIYLSDAEAWDVPQDKALSEDEKADIKSNIEQALKELGIAGEIE